jgi:hypothetical protein
MNNQNDHDLSYNQRKELQCALRNFITDLNLPLFITINFNTKISKRRAEKILRELHKRLDRKMLGRRFYKRSKEERTFFVAMPEHMKSNYHYHLLLRPPTDKELYFRFNAWFHLMQLVPSASIMILKPKTADDVRATSFYSCKDSFKAENYDSFILSTQFASFKNK